MSQPRSHLSNERLAALESKVDGTVADVGRLAEAVDKLATAVSGVTATAQVLASADAALTARVVTLETAFAAFNDKRLELFRDQEQRFGALTAQVQQVRGEAQAQVASAVATALREARESERRADDREFSKGNQTQNNQLMVIMAIVGISSTLLLLILNLIVQMAKH